MNRDDLKASLAIGLGILLGAIFVTLFNLLLGALGANPPHFFP